MHFMMVNLPIYMDNHATTRVDPRVVEAMLPYFSEKYGNAGSISHSFGWEARDAVDAARETIARAIGADAKEVVFTSGATESNNLAIRGVAERPRRKGNHLVSVTTEHKAVLEPLSRLSRRGYELSLVPVQPAGEPDAGRIDPRQVADAIRDETALVSVMLANNEIGVIQPVREIAAECHRRGVPLHCDATQAVGKMSVNVRELAVDLMSFSSHKIYGPKGIGALYVRRGTGIASGTQSGLASGTRSTVKLDPQITGGGQEAGFRAGTLNVPGIIGFARAIELCLEELPREQERLRGLRKRLYDGLTQAVELTVLNGPALEPPDWRLPGNLNVSFTYVDGEALLLSIKDVAVSTGAACTSANPEPSHVLRAIGLSDDLVRASVRFGLGRFNTEEEVDYAIEAMAAGVKRLRQLSSVA
jgi:cysteine desulfurase